MKKLILLFTSVYIFALSSASAVFPVSLVAGALSGTITTLGGALAVLSPIVLPIATELTASLTENMDQVIKGECPSFCRGMALTCQTTAGFFMCKGLCQKITRVSSYEIKIRFSDEFADNSRYLHSPWSLETCTSKWVKANKGALQAQGDYDFKVMSLLPKDKKGKESPAKQTIYLEKMSDEGQNLLKYTVVNPKGKTVTDTINMQIDIDIKETLTIPEIVKQHKFEILEYLIRKGHIYTWKSIAVFKKEQLAELVRLINLEVAVRKLITGEVVSVEPEKLKEFLSKTFDAGATSEQEKLVGYAKQALLQIQNAIIAKRREIPQ